MSTDALLEGSFAAALARLDYEAGIALTVHLFFTEELVKKKAKQTNTNRTHRVGVYRVQ